MKSNVNEFFTEPEGGEYKLKLLSLVVILVLFCGYFFSLIFDTVESYNRLVQQKIYIREWSFVLPGMFSMPVFFSAIYILCLRVLGKMTQRKMDFCMKIIICFGALFIVSRIAYGFVIETFLEGRGYNYCYSYSGVSAGSVNIWVKDPNFCVKNSGVVRKKTLDWIDYQVANQQQPTPNEVHIAVQKLLEEYQAEIDSY